MNIARKVLRAGCVALCVLGASLMVRPAGPVQAGGPPADFTKIRFYTAGELLGIQRSIFETLFLQPWEEEHWEYPLDALYAGVGIYTGTNQYAQEFELSVRFQGQADLKEVVLSPEQRQWAADNHFAIAGVIGDLRHADARIRVHGVVVTMRDTQGIVRSRFWLTNTCEVVEEEPEPLDVEAETRPLAAPRSNAEEGGAPIPANACHEACAAARNLRIERANRDYDLAVATAAQVRDIDKNNARTAYQSAVQSATDALSASVGALLVAKTYCLAGCLPAVASGPGALACVLTCQGLYAAGVAAASIVYNSNMNTAAGTRDSAFATADAIYNVTVNAAATTRNNAINDANADDNACVAGCGGGQGGGGKGGPEQVVPEEP